MAKRRLLVSRNSNHSIIQNNDIAVDAEGNPLQVTGSGVLNLREYNNPDPQEGQVWKHDGKFWARLGGNTREIGVCGCPYDPGSSSSSSSPPRTCGRTRTSKSSR